MSFKRKQTLEKSASLTMANRAFNPALAADMSEMHYATIDDAPSKRKKRTSGSLKSKDHYDYVATSDVDAESKLTSSGSTVGLHSRGKKKANVFYESAGELKLVNKSKHRVANDTTIFIILFIAAFILAGVCLIVSMLAVLRVTEKSNSGLCSACTQFVPLADVTRLQSLEQQLNGYITERTSNLLLREAKLASRQPVAGPVGPQGFSGPQGIPGPKGVAGGVDLSLCRYKYKNNSVTIGSPVSQTSISTPTVHEDLGYTFTSVYCSYRGAAEYSLFSESTNGSSSYHCTCAGKAQTLPLQPVAGIIECIIHYWQCPRF